MKPGSIAPLYIMDAYTNICKIYSKGPSTDYRATCACTSPEHDQHISISVDKDNEIETLHVVIHSTLRHCNYSTECGTNILYKFYKRFKSACKILFTGSVEVESEFIFQTKEQVEDYIKALSSGVDNAKKHMSNL